jgi:hypothetical protein
LGLRPLRFRARFWLRTSLRLGAGLRLLRTSGRLRASLWLGPGLRLRSRRRLLRTSLWLRTRFGLWRPSLRLLRTRSGLRARLRLRSSLRLRANFGRGLRLWTSFWLLRARGWRRRRRLRRVSAFRYTRASQRLRYRPALRNLGAFGLGAPVRLRTRLRRGCAYGFSRRTWRRGPVSSGQRPGRYEGGRRDSAGYGKLRAIGCRGPDVLNLRRHGSGSRIARYG